VHGWHVNNRKLFRAVVSLAITTAKLHASVARQEQSLSILRNSGFSADPEETMLRIQRRQSLSLFFSERRINLTIVVSFDEKRSKGKAPLYGGLCRPLSLWLRSRKIGLNIKLRRSSLGQRKELANRDSILCKLALLSEREESDWQCHERRARIHQLKYLRCNSDFEKCLG